MAPEKSLANSPMERKEDEKNSEWCHRCETVVVVGEHLCGKLVSEVTVGELMDAIESRFRVISTNP